MFELRYVYNARVRALGFASAALCAASMLLAAGCVDIPIPAPSPAVASPARQPDSQLLYAEIPNKPTTYVHEDQYGRLEMKITPRPRRLSGGVFATCLDSVILGVSRIL